MTESNHRIYSRLAAKAADLAEDNLYGKSILSDTREVLDETLALTERLLDDYSLPLLYEKCALCHLFVHDNPAHREGDDIAKYLHGSRGDEADERIDNDHEATPSGLKATLDTWRIYGPSAMRERFVFVPDGNGGVERYAQD